MSFKRITTAAVWIGLLFPSLGETAPKKKLKHSPLTYASSACTKSEKWYFTKKFSREWREEFNRFLDSSHSVVRGFSEALALRQMGDSLEEKMFAEYWVSRSIFRSNLPHIAARGFKALIERPLVSRNAGIQAAAMECLAQISERYPSIRPPSTLIRQLEAVSKTKHAGKLASARWKAAHAIFRDRLSLNRPVSEMNRILRLLKGSGSYEALSQATLAARRNNYEETVKWSRKFLSSKRRPKRLKKYEDVVRLLAARALYSQRDYKKSAKYLKQIKKSSNYLAQSLSDLSWSYLLEGSYREAVGTSINLQTGGLRHTFAPEAPMVMAMALNELCQYPEAIRSVSVFRNNYKDTYFWLKNWSKSKSRKNTDFYKLAIGYLKSESELPPRLASEWIRSPLFIARQDEINLFFDEKSAIKRMGRVGTKEQEEQARELLEYITAFKKNYRQAKAKQKPGTELPDRILDGLRELRSKVVHYKRLRRAAPVWRRVLASHEQLVDPTIRTLVRAMNKDLYKISFRMLAQLEEVVENNQLIEIEIYNGASADIIWQNAHPDYDGIAKGIQAKAYKKPGSGVWSWGNVQEGLQGDGEIWEDELGSFKADIYDNCTSKDKYLALKRVEALQRAREAAK